VNGEEVIILKGRRLAHYFTGADTLCHAGRTRKKLIGAEVWSELPKDRKICPQCVKQREEYLGTKQGVSRSEKNKEKRAVYNRQRYLVRKQEKEARSDDV